MRSASDSLLATNEDDNNQTIQHSTSLIVNENKSFDLEQDISTFSINNNTSHRSRKWIIFGTDDDNNNKTDKTLEEQYETFILHLRHASATKTEFDIYQILAFLSQVTINDNTHIKPFKSLKGIINEKWSDLQILWLNSYQRVFCQAIICFLIQTIGVSTVLITTFHSYFQSPRSKCDYHAARWNTDTHLKLLAFVWTSFISLGVSGWIYRARHSGFYSILLFMKQREISYPPFVNITILQLGLLANYYVVAASVFGSYILIYQTEGGTETVNMILQAVALFFVLELDFAIVHKRDFVSIYSYFDEYISNNLHKQLPSGPIPNNNVFQKECCYCCKRQKPCCYGQSCLQISLDIILFMLLIVMSIGALLAPFLVMICW
eukprot:354574_1